MELGFTPNGESRPLIVSMIVHLGITMRETGKGSKAQVGGEPYIYMADKVPHASVSLR